VSFAGAGASVVVDVISADLGVPQD
jgi:hypothetical protein